jgi:hypothetical protein
MKALMQSRSVALASCRSAPIQGRRLSLANLTRLGVTRQEITGGDRYALASYSYRIVCQIEAAPLKPYRPDSRSVLALATFIWGALL